MKEMSENAIYASYAILCELSNRDFRRKIGLIPEELRYYFILASGIIGAENAKRLNEVPAGVAKDGEEFVEKLAAIADPGKDDLFKGVLKTCLLETMRDELRCCCANCVRFNRCIDLPHLSALGDLFKRRAEGEEADDIKNEIVREVEGALAKTPYCNSEDADRLCPDFQHQYALTRLGELFGRYSEIGIGLQAAFGLDYAEVKREMILLNMAFAERVNGNNGSALL